MTFSFEVFLGRGRGRKLGRLPSVSITVRGIFYLNGPAAALLGKPSAVTFLFDRQQNAIGIRAADPDASLDVAHPVYKQEGESYYTRGTAFCRHYNIDMSETRRYQPFFDEASRALIIRLSTPQ